MKYLQLTYVDAVTQRPLSEEPAANGPMIPEGIVPLFDIQSSRSNVAPIVYGWAEDEYEVPSFVYEISEETFFSAYKTELKERARQKRKHVEQSGVEVSGQRIGTEIEDQNRVSNMVTTLINDPEMEFIDFEYAPSQWVQIPRTFGLEVGKAVGRHVQSCFSWCKGVHEQIDALTLSLDTLDAMFPIMHSINTFGMPVLQESSPELDDEGSN